MRRLGACIDSQSPLPAALRGKHQAVTATLSWDTSTLPHHVQWRMPGAGTHVLGIEPTNCNVRGRAAARADGSLQMIEPGEAVRLQFAIRNGCNDG